MIENIRTRQPQTLAEYNNSIVRLTGEILSGKEYRRKRRKKLKKPCLKFGSEKINVYL